MKYITAITLLVLTCYQLGQAAADQKRTCRLYLLEPAPEAPREAYLFDGTSSHEVRLSTKNFSAVIEVPAGDISLVMTPNQIQAQDDLPTAAPAAQVTAGVVDFYLLVTANPDNDTLPVKLEVIPITAEFEPGETLWLSFFEHTINAQLGAKSLAIPPLERVISAPPLQQGGYYQAQFHYLPQHSDQPLQTAKKSWWFDPSSRYLGFILDQGTRLPKIFAIRDKR